MSTSPPRQRRRLADPDSDDDGIDDGLGNGPLQDDYRADDDGAINEDVDRDDDGPAEPDDGEDLEDNMEADYMPIAELDQYDPGLLDQREYGAMEPELRAQAERAMRDRDAALGGRLGGILDEYGSEGEDDRTARRARVGLRARRDGGGGDGGDGGDGDDGGDGGGGDVSSDDDEEGVNLEAFEVPLQEWIMEDRTRREVKRRFRRFLQTFVAEGGTAPAYEYQIRNMCSANLASLEVSYLHLSQAVPILAIWLADAPRELLEIMDEVATQVVTALFPSYASIQDELHVRITDLPIVDKLRDLRECHLDALVRVHGVVTRRSGVFPQLKLVKYSCVRCQTVVGPFKQDAGGGEIKPGLCPMCNSEGPFKINQEQTVFRNYQKISLQESPGSVPAGRVPRHKDVILLADLIDQGRPGEEIEVTGIYCHSYDLGLSQRSGFPVFGTHIEANFIQKREDLLGAHSLTDEDRRAILQLSRDPRVAKRIIASIAPSIYGHRHVKTAIALSLFGGCAKNVNDKHRIRGDINVLLLGDPGTAKSQVLKYCEKTAPRAVYTTGKGASAVGLTAGVHKDPVTKEWMLEGGALVLADKGMCLIDEFDKMNEQDRTSIHEAMEQQSISISKAGIVTSLQARCAVVAAANPIGGRYDASLTLAENVELTDPILQRFDCLCVLQDLVDPVADEQLARFVVESHRRSHPTHPFSGSAPNSEDLSRGPQSGGAGGPIAAGTQEEPIPQALLKKYIMYARNHVRPQLHDIDTDKVAKLYADLRKESMSSGGVPIAVRHIESIMRMSESHARMHLRDHVREDDVDLAIQTMLESFIQAQKFSVRRTLERGFRKYLTQGADFFELIMHELQRLMRQAQTFQQLRSGRSASAPPTADSDPLEVEMDELEARAREFGVFDLGPFYESQLIASHGMVVDHQQRIIIKNFE